MLLIVLQQLSWGLSRPRAKRDGPHANLPLFIDFDRLLFYCTEISAQKTAGRQDSTLLLIGY